MSCESLELVVSCESPELLVTDLASAACGDVLRLRRQLMRHSLYCTVLLQ